MRTSFGWIGKYGSFLLVGDKAMGAWLRLGVQTWLINQTGSPINQGGSPVNQRVWNPQLISTIAPHLIKIFIDTAYSYRETHNFT